MAVFSMKIYIYLTLSWRVWQLLARDPHSFDMTDHMGWKEKHKMMTLSKDLFKDSLLQMRQIIEVRSEHERLIAFNVGMIMGRIREKYRFMMETYRDILDSYHDRHWAKPPGIRTLRPMHFVIALEMMHYLELEIDKLVDVLVEEGALDFKSSGNTVGQTEEREWWKDEDEKDKNGTDSKGEGSGPLDMHGPPPRGPEVPGDPGGPGGPNMPRRMRSRSDLIREQKEKSMLRQQYLMRKLGMSANMTTQKKRFVRHWPVEDTWTLDKYYHDY